MIHRRLSTALAAGLVNLVLPLATVTLLTLPGCSHDHPIHGPAAPVAGTEVTGTLVAKKDDRPVDGGIDLTLKSAPGVREIVRVPSAYIAGPRDSVLAMHAVVDASQIGDRLYARGTRDATGALRAEVLERLAR